MKHYDLLTGEPFTEEQERVFAELQATCPVLPKQERLEEPEALSEEDEAILADIWGRNIKAP